MFDILEEIRDLLEENLGNKFKKYYIGKVATIPINYLPFLSVYGTNTTITSPHTTCKDLTDHNISIEIISTAHGFISTQEDINRTQQAQKALYNLMEERSSGVATPQSVLGVIRRNLQGTNYLFIDEIDIEYPAEPPKSEENTYYKAIINCVVHRQYADRS